MKKSIVCLALAFLASNAFTKNDVLCPESLTPEHLKDLADKGEITLQSALFKLDGASQKYIKNIDMTQDAPFAYERSDSHKLACWYQSNQGYLCIREK